MVQKRNLGAKIYKTIDFLFNINKFMRLQRKSPLRIALAEFHAFLYEFPVPVAVSGVAWLYEAMGGLYR